MDQGPGGSHVWRLADGLIGRARSTLRSESTAIPSVEVLLVVAPQVLSQTPERQGVVRQLDTPVRLGLSIRSKLSWCGAVCQAPKWLLPRSGGSGVP